ncbi:MAG: cyclic nucleotide-binding domain-containing protein [Alphaproteobacteria bacterium]|nr:cyclic nucleotide-binding domain-containing protein [Alphaproteobacteria bacterium]
MITALPPMFAGLEPQDQEQARAMLQAVRFNTGDVVMAEGEEDNSIAFVVSGTAELLVDDSRVGVVGSRDTIGEMELFTGKKRMNTVRALNQLDLLVLDGSEFAELCETGNPVVYRLEQHALRKVGDRLRSMDEQIVQMSDGEPFTLNPHKASLLDRLNPFRRKNARPELDVTEILSESELFGWAAANQLDELAGDFTTASFSNDERICIQGEPGQTMYIVANGQVDVVLQVAEDRAEHISTLGPGMAFGDSAILHACPRTATCVAKGDVQCLVMDRDHFMAITETLSLPSSVFRQGLIRNLVMHVERATKRFVFLDRARKAKEDEYYKGTPVSSVWRD